MQGIYIGVRILYHATGSHSPKLEQHLRCAEQEYQEAKDRDAIMV